MPLSVTVLKVRVPRLFPDLSVLIVLPKPNRKKDAPLRALGVRIVTLAKRQQFTLGVNSMFCLKRARTLNCC